MHRPDLRIVDADFVGAHENLSAVARGFRENAQLVEDIRCALGHDGLADKLSSFAGSWRIKREQMQDAFETLAQEIKRQLDDWQRLDEGPDAETEADRHHDNSSPHESGDTTRSRTSPREGDGGQLGSLSQAPTTPHSTSQRVADPAHGPFSTEHTATGAAAAAGDEAPGRDSTSSGGDEVEVTIDETGDTFRALIPPGVAGGSTAALIALLGVWQSRHSGTPVQGKADPSSGHASPEQRLLAEFDRLRGDGKALDVTLIEDPRQPGDVLAILRGDDGSAAILDLTPEATGSGDPAPAPLDEPSGTAEPPLETDPGNPDALSTSPGRGGPEGTSEAQALAPGVSLGGNAEPGAGSSEPLQAPAGFDAVPIGDPVTTSGSPAERLAAVEADLPPQEQASRPVAGAAAGMGMAGIAASQSAQSASSRAAETRFKPDELKRPHEHDSRKKEDDAQ